MSKEKKPKYQLNRQGEFIIENYNLAKPFANFFPGIAGKYGIPMWVFYVNRGQGIVSFGTKDKDHSILEFLPANKAWQLASLQGFRTFIKLFKGKKTQFYEPFNNNLANLEYSLTSKMSITSYDLKLEEENTSLGLKVSLEYFTIPQDSYAALTRIVSIKNTQKTTKTIQLLDGLPQIIPYGTANLFLKKLSRTVEAWMDVENIENNVPFYKLDVDPTDRPEVIHIQKGNFYLGFHYEKEKTKIIRPVIDPQSVFGAVSDFTYPSKFLEAKHFQAPKNEIAKSKTPCAFLPLDLVLAPGQEKTFYSIIGYMRNCQTLNSSIARITAPGYLKQKKEENKHIIDELQSDINTESATREFDLYAKQTYLDNIMRGGYPVIFSNSKKSSTQNAIFYLYGRKHGDLERDYNKFHLSATYFSQGNGNYRDMNQNRRCDVWFNPEIKDGNIATFLNLLQTDGFNPLVIKGAYFTLAQKNDIKATLNKLANEQDTEKIALFLEKPFTPGELTFFIEENKIKLNASPDEFLNLVISYSLPNQEAEHAEGFWTDHWTYNLDLLESYLGIYPEELKSIVFEKRVFSFFDNTETVKPRSEKYMLYDGHVRQLQAVCPDSAKKDLLRTRSSQPNVVRSEYGLGAIYQTTLINKLLCLLVNKLSSLDPFGCGIEMEAGKPNWFDSLNGLPALFGSSLCETFELKRLILFIKRALKEARIEKITVTEEIHDFLSSLSDLIKTHLENTPADSGFLYWDKSYALKESYREKTRLGLSGKEIEKDTSSLGLTLDLALEKVNQGIDKAYEKKNNVYYAYFINEVAEYQALKTPFVKPTKFNQRRLPLFLEGQMHALRLAEDIKQAKKLYSGTKNSALYDKENKMYKVTAALAGMPEEIGRCRVFTPGWLENESVWLHMEYKYLLEILKQGLYEDFYAEFKNVLIPFLKPQSYGRSILENSSFLVSSAFPDKSLHGNGFVARLSGSTAEFLQIWLTMNLGNRPFFLNGENKLNLRFSPLLAGWLFNKKGEYSFNFLSKIPVTYHNPKRKNTFGKNAAIAKEIIFHDKDGLLVKISKDIIPAPYAEQIRSCQIKRIDITLL